MLLLWQLNAAVAVTVPHVAAVAQATGVPSTHCAKQHHDGLHPASQPTTSPAPSAPDCCHDHAATCHCAQPPALAMPGVDFDEAPPPVAPALAGVPPGVDSGAADFFRPPI